MFKTKLVKYQKIWTQLVQLKYLRPNCHMCNMFKAKLTKLKDLGMNWHKYNDLWLFL